mgnify:FL=1
MGFKKSNYSVYSSMVKIDNVSKPINITNLIKRNKIEQQKDKLLKIHTLLGSSGLVLLFVIFIFYDNPIF